MAAKISPTIAYFQDSVQELKKVVWPTKNQSIRLTILVLVVVMVTALIIGVLDFAFGQGRSLLLNIADRGPTPIIETSSDFTATPGIEVGEVTVSEPGEETPIE